MNYKPYKKYKVYLSDMIFIGTYNQLKKRFTKEDLYKLESDDKIREV